MSPVSKDLPQGGRYKKRVSDHAERPQRRRIVDAIFHPGAITVGVEVMLVPPAAIRPRFLGVSEKTRRFPRFDIGAPFKRHRAQP